MKTSTTSSEQAKSIYSVEVNKEKKNKIIPSAQTSSKRNGETNLDWSIQKTLRRRKNKNKNKRIENIPLLTIAHTQNLMFSSFSVSTTEQNKPEYHQYQQTSAAIKRESSILSSVVLSSARLSPAKLQDAELSKRSKKTQEIKPSRNDLFSTNKRVRKKSEHTPSWSKARLNTADIYNHIQRKRSHTHVHKFTRDTTPLTATRMRWEERTIARGSKQAHASAPFGNPAILCLYLCFCETTKKRWKLIIKIKQNHYGMNI